MRVKSYQVKRRLCVRPSTRLSPAKVIHSCEMRLYNLRVPPQSPSCVKRALETFGLPYFFRGLAYKFADDNTLCSHV